MQRPHLSRKAAKQDGQGSFPFVAEIVRFPSPVLAIQTRLSFRSIDRMLSHQGPLAMAFACFRKRKWHSGPIPPRFCPQFIPTTLLRITHASELRLMPRAWSVCIDESATAASGASSKKKGNNWTDPFSCRLVWYRELEKDWQETVKHEKESIDRLRLCSIG